MTTIEAVYTNGVFEPIESVALPDKQRVRLSFERVGQITPESRLEALRRAAGSWVDDGEGLDAYLQWNQQQRKCARPEPE